MNGPRATLRSPTWWTVSWLSDFIPPIASERIIVQAETAADAERVAMERKNGRGFTTGAIAETWLDQERRANLEWSQKLAEAADPDCRICRGRGNTNGYIAPSKSATYACPCTGMAAWQAA